MPRVLVLLVKKFEGLRLKVYQCMAGVWTIGYGHTGPDVNKNTPPISEAEADRLLGKDLEVFYVGVAKMSPILLLPGNENRRCAIASWAFNLGLGRYKTSTLKRRVDEGDWEGAIVELKKWVRAGGKVARGLELRRDAESLLLR